MLKRHPFTVLPLLLAAALFASGCGTADETTDAVKDDIDYSELSQQIMEANQSEQLFRNHSSASITNNFTCRDSAVFSFYVTPDYYFETDNAAYAICYEDGIIYSITYYEDGDIAEMSFSPVLRDDGSFLKTMFNDEDHPVIDTEHETVLECVTEDGILRVAAEVDAEKSGNTFNPWALQVTAERRYPMNRRQMLKPMKISRPHISRRRTV